MGGLDSAAWGETVGVALFLLVLRLSLESYKTPHTTQPLSHTGTMTVDPAERALSVRRELREDEECEYCSERGFKYGRRAGSERASGERAAPAAHRPGSAATIMIYDSI